MEEINKLKLFIELPLGIQLKMLEFQVASGNPMDPNVFKKDITANARMGGFTWDRFIDNNFWTEVLKGNYDLFFKRFPRSEYPKFAFIYNGKSYQKVLVAIKNNNIYNYITEITNLESFLNHRDTFFNINKTSEIYELEDIVKSAINVSPVNNVLSVENGQIIIKQEESTEKTFPRVMLVRHNKTDYWKKRVVIDYKAHRYIAWFDAETLEDAKNKTSTTAWKYAKELEDEFVVTKEEISKFFNIPIDKIIIK